MREHWVFALIVLVSAHKLPAQNVKSTFLVKQKVDVYQNSAATVEVLQPVLPVQLGVEVEQGPPLGPGDALSCIPKVRAQKQKTADGKSHMMQNIILVCDKRTLVVKSLRFTPN